VDNKRLLQVSHKYTKIGILVDDIDYKLQEINLEECVEPQNIQYNHIEAMFPSVDGYIYLINEKNFFREITKCLKQNEIIK
jgi:hypothetical protein